MLRIIKKTNRDYEKHDSEKIKQMKIIALVLVFFFTIINTHAQNLQGTLVFSHHNDTSTIHPDTIYSINNAGQKAFVTLGYRPAVSHTGDHMAFANGQNPNQSLYASMWIRNLITHKDMLVFSNGGDYLDYFDFSPHDSQLAYGFACSMYTTNIDGTNSFHDIGCTPCDCYSDQPVVRLSDSALTYHNVHNGIYTKNYDGSNPLQVPNTLPGDLFPVWSPDGQWIAYYKTKSGGYYVTNAIYKIKPDGANQTLLLQLAATDTLTPDPVWSSDMANIYFIAHIQNSFGIYKLKTDGSGSYQKLFSLNNSASINDYWLGLTDFVSSVLPLTLTNFNAAYQEGKAHLAWQTAQENNSSYFDVERSADGINFSKIGSVSAKGNSNNIINYSFTDKALPYENSQQQLFYRLKMVDKDGHFTYSKIMSVYISSVLLSIKISPNPAKNILQITGLNPFAAATISIINFSGNVIKKTIAKDNNYFIDVSNLPAGMYYIRVEENKKITNLKFVKE